MASVSPARSFTAIVFDGFQTILADCGADESISGSDGHEFLCRPDDFAAVRDALEAKLGAPQSAKIVWKPSNTVAVNDTAGETLAKLLEALDDHDDVQNVYANYELSDALMEKLSAA